MSYELCKSIAMQYHQDQTDPDGSPHIQHVMRVVCRVLRSGSDHEKQAAWLHDILEDTNLTANDLLAMGVSPRVVKIVTTLTRQDDVAYVEYIMGIVRDGSYSALIVKEADLEDNLERSERTGHSLAGRYRKALALVRGELERRNDDRARVLALKSNEPRT